MSDQRNVGTVTGIAACSVVGCFTFGIGCIAGIAGVVVGSTLGRCFGNRFGNKKKKKNAKTTQEDLYLRKLRYMIQLGKTQKKKLRNDINKLRLTIEKVNSLYLEKFNYLRLSKSLRQLWKYQFFKSQKKLRP